MADHVRLVEFVVPEGDYDAEYEPQSIVQTTNIADPVEKPVDRSFCLEQI